VFVAAASRLCRKPGVGFDPGPCPDADRATDQATDRTGEQHPGLDSHSRGPCPCPCRRSCRWRRHCHRRRRRSYPSHHPAQLSTAVDNFLHILWITDRRPVGKAGRGQASTMWNDCWTSHHHELPR
jgi:hypothetical protein